MAEALERGFPPLGPGRIFVVVAESHRAEIQIAPVRGFSPVPIQELWAYRELLGFMVWRDVSVRYKQSLLGILWALLTPLIAMAIFTIIFGRFAEIPTAGIPYPIFTYSALLPWTLFASSITFATPKIVQNRSLIRKVYFPREILPLSGVMAALVDFCLAFILLAALMAYYHIAPTFAVLWVPLLLVIQLLLFDSGEGIKGIQRYGSRAGQEHHHCRRGGTEDYIDHRAGGGGDELGPGGHGCLHTGQAAQRPHQNVVGIAADAAGAVAVPEFVDQDHAEQQPCNHRPETQSAPLGAEVAKELHCDPQNEEQMHAHPNPGDSSQGQRPIDRIIALTVPQIHDPHILA